MKTAVLYTAVTGGNFTTDLIARFVSTFHENPPGYDCDLWVACNGGPLQIDQQLMFTPLNAKMFPNSNDGFDIGSYVRASRGPCKDYDAVLWAGESVYFTRRGWLKRFEEAWQRHGQGMYGAFSSNVVRSHMNTTAFFCAPSLLSCYPFNVSSKKDRYEFEHGTNSMWRRVAARGLPVRLVTWDGEWEPRLWRLPQNILWRGDQSNLLMRCNHCDNWEKASPLTKHRWSVLADMPFS